MTMKPMSLFPKAILSLTTLTLAACSHTVPAELVSARAAYQRSSESKTAQVVPAELHVAKVALNKAERSFTDKDDAYITRDLAYVAERKSELADAKANIATEQDNTTASKAEFSTVQGEIVKSTKADLTEAKADLTQTRSALMAALARLAAVKEEERGLVITLSGSVLFESGESTLLPAAVARLDELSEALMSSKDRMLVIEGHTDSQGGDRQNLDLSQRRADAVRTHLLSRGYPSSNVRSVGIGEGRPIADNKSPEGRSNNRRVEIIIQNDGSGATGAGN